MDDRQAAWDVLYELARTFTATMNAWDAAQQTDASWVALREAFIAVRMTAEIGEEVCDDALANRHLSVAPTES